MHNLQVNYVHPAYIGVLQQIKSYQITSGFALTYYYKGTLYIYYT